MRSMLSGLIGAAALALAAPVQADGVERVAIVVGANLAPTGRVPLRYAHEDAKAVAKVLTEVGDFQSDDVELLLEPTPSRVLAAIDEAVARLGQGSESLVLFYYSGHSDSTALYPGGEPLPLADLQRRLEDLRISVRLGVIDSCRGGAWTGTKGLQPAPLFDVSAAGALNNVGSALIAASSGGAWKMPTSRSSSADPSSRTISTRACAVRPTKTAIGASVWAKPLNTPRHSRSVTLR
jgi:hypothetical protein